ncbi:hypothetical protein KSS87_021798 [Heliosperma pusillum]|nr:hypothetical protein KSS87_021798 [Heliosperma pusillum]
MSEFQIPGMLDEIQALVSDHLQVVSYKWLSRKFLVSSNAARRLLQEFVEKNEDELEVIYSVVGWLKDSTTYHIKLVPKPKLEEAKHDFDGNCSVQVYSVQRCIPNDLAAIWNVEFIQTEELFKQALTEDNCLSDNRFCGVPNLFVKRDADGVASLPVPATMARGPGASGQAIGSLAKQISSIPQPQKKLPDSSPNLGLQSSNTTSTKNVTDKTAGHDLQKEVNKDKLPAPPSKNRGHNDKSPAGGSLANLWGRASSKSNSSKEDKDVAQNNDLAVVVEVEGFDMWTLVGRGSTFGLNGGSRLSLLGQGLSSAGNRSGTATVDVSGGLRGLGGVPDSADAQICAIENLEAGSSDDDEPGVNFRRPSNGDGGKKRRVVLDDSDEEDFENAVNLGSPDPPKVKLVPELKQKTKTILFEDNILNDEQKETIPIKKDEKVTSSEANNPFKKDFAALDQGKKRSLVSAEEKEVPPRATVSTSNKNNTTDRAPGSPKRKKVLKTRIDERGREVTEVVWEGKEDVNPSNAGKNANGQTVKTEDNAVVAPVQRAATTKKSPATGNTAPAHAAGKAGGKKGANTKDPKQGNIMSFFKKKV